MVEATALAEAERLLAEEDPDEFVAGMPRRMYFGHTRKRALVITASDYSKLREVEGKEKYADLLETVNDREVIAAGI